MQVPLSLRRPWSMGRARWWVLAVSMVAVAVWMAWAAHGVDPDVKAGVTLAPGQDATIGSVAVASTARVEGASETIDIGAGMDGVIAELRVSEGDAVSAGDVLAVIDRRELNAELAGARAGAEAARQARTRILRGSRREDRERADAEVTATEAVLAQAESQHRRSVHLFQQGVLSEAERDEVRRNLDVAQAQLAAARKRAELVKAPPLPEEAAKADADVRGAEERVRALQQMQAKCYVRAPVSGTVLKTLLRPGESFSTTVPRPIMTLADTSRMRVRAEVDERDIGRVFAGQRVLVRGDGWEDPGVPGRVDRLAVQMGRKTVKTGDPAEKSDRDILEVLVDLDGHDPRLVVGLRVTALFLKATGSSASPAASAP